MHQQFVAAPRSDSVSAQHDELGHGFHDLWRPVDHLKAMDTLTRDVRYALRTFWKNRASTVLVVATLAIGIAANAAVFSVLDAVVLRPLPHPDPERLVWIMEANPVEGFPQFRVSTANLRDWKTRSRAFENLAGFNRNNYTVTGGQQPEQLYAYGITRGFMELLGLRPALGRLFRPEEYESSGSAVAIIGDTFWDRQFGRDPGAVGRTLTLDGVSVTIVGVLPPDGVDAFDEQFDVTVPLTFTGIDLTSRASRQLVVYGRLTGDASLEGARAELTSIASGLARAFPETNADWTVTVDSLTERVVGPFRPQLLALQGVVFLVLLIAVANVANLLLVRATQREREISIRAAVGGDRGRIVRQLCTESALLVVAGGALGLLLAQWLLWALLSEAPALPRMAETALNVRVLAFAICLAGFSTVLFGLVPAWWAAAPSLSITLKSAGSQGSEGPKRSILRDVFTVAEIAVSLILLSGAGLLIKDLVTSIPATPGFEARDKLTVRLNLQPLDYGEPEQRLAVVDTVVRELDTLPGVSGVAAANFLPFDGYSMRTYVDVDGRTDGPFSDRAIEYRAVSANYFQTLGLRVEQGRPFVELDDATGPGAMILGAQVAGDLFGDGLAIGRRLVLRPWSVTVTRTGESTPKTGTVVGVVSDVVEHGADEPRRVVYVPYRQHPDETVSHGHQCRRSGRAGSGRARTDLGSRPGPAARQHRDVRRPSGRALRARAVLHPGDGVVRRHRARVGGHGRLWRPDLRFCPSRQGNGHPARAGRRTGRSVRDGNVARRASDRRGTCAGRCGVLAAHAGFRQLPHHG